jgi:uncharacterized protein
MVDVQDVPERHRYEARVGGELAGYIDYRSAGAERIFRHTQVLDAFEGEGVGSALARAALDDLRARDLTVRPLCPFIAGWLRRHPDYLDLVTEGHPIQPTP